MKAIVEVATEIFHNRETKKATREVISSLPVISQYSKLCNIFSALEEVSAPGRGTICRSLSSLSLKKKNPSSLLTDIIQTL